VCSFFAGLGGKAIGERGKEGRRATLIEVTRLPGNGVIYQCRRGSDTARGEETELQGSSSGKCETVSPAEKSDGDAEGAAGLRVEAAN